MIESRAADPEVNVIEVFTDPTVATMVVVPGDPAVTRPLEFTVATGGFEELHVADDVSS